MLGSMYSGVSGMKAHQTKLNVIGNNIANVNTYGFKASRASFRDVYYQTLKSGATGTNSSGGSNASQVGYGAQMGSIDLLMNRTSFQMTDRSMDMAIDGEGFFQVQDAAGNKFYTRAGAMNFDAAGNLVDSQGNFVLGVSGNPLGKAAGSSLIQLQIPAVPPTAASSEDEINSVKFKISSSNNTKDGNVNFTFVPDSSLADSELVKAQVGTSGIVISVNPSATFTSMSAFSNEVNNAIKDYCMANNGKEHPAGDFTITCEPSSAFPAAGGLTGKQLCSNDFGTQYGSVDGWPTSTVFGGIKPSGISGADFGKNWGANAKVNTGPTWTYVPENTTAGSEAPARGEMTMKIGNTEYIGYIVDNASGESAGKFRLYPKKADGTPDTTSKDFIEMKRPSFDGLMDEWMADTGTAAGTAPPAWNLPAADQTALYAATPTASAPSKNLGLSDKKMMLSGGTAGGPQGVENLSGISIGSDGVITAQHAMLGDITVGRIDLVTFANPEGLKESGGTYFTPGPNSGKVSYTEPGQEGAGPLATGSLEMSNVDLSREFADMITTQRGFQANTRLITVSDEVLNELVNLKR